jgi:hypothetical protein
VAELLRRRVSLPALQNNGGWTSPAVPTQEYADQESDAARHKAAAARAVRLQPCHRTLPYPNLILTWGDHVPREDFRNCK